VNFSIQIKQSAARELERLDIADRKRIAEAIDRLAEQPLLGHALKGDARGLRRLLVGEYRVIYEVQDDALVVLVIHITRWRSGRSGDGRRSGARNNGG